MNIERIARHLAVQHAEVVWARRKAIARGVDPDRSGAVQAQLKQRNAVHNAFGIVFGVTEYRIWEITSHAALRAGDVPDELAAYGKLDWFTAFTDEVVPTLSDILKEA